MSGTWSDPRNGLFEPPGICWAVLDMSGPYRLAYDEVLPHAGQSNGPVPRHKASPTTVVLIYDAEPGTNPWDIGDAKVTDCISHGGWSPKRMSGSAKAANPTLEPSRSR